MFDSVFLWIGVLVVIFMICISLLIFAPKGKNYFNSNIYPILKYLHENNLQVFKDDFKKIKDANWIDYNIDVQGKCSMCPLYMFSITSKKKKLSEKLTECPTNRHSWNRSIRVQLSFSIEGYRLNQ